MPRVHGIFPSLHAHLARALAPMRPPASLFVIPGLRLPVVMHQIYT
jgi:hypothetical protein